VRLLNFNCCRINNRLCAEFASGSLTLVVNKHVPRLAPGFWLKIRYQQSDTGLSIHQGRLGMKMGFEV
jgi:hypothetical protein